ncbi:hypothetical protein M426DRAFT_191264 [Hypoxylon sp. CI-4A]|nr:hypothetical protein M426DRAFT_191264 [Hypoxylon sp. CI-4A]
MTFLSSLARTDAGASFLIPRQNTPQTPRRMLVTSMYHYVAYQLIQCHSMFFLSFGNLGIRSGSLFSHFIRLGQGTLGQVMQKPVIPTLRYSMTAHDKGGLKICIAICQIPMSDSNSETWYDEHHKPPTTNRICYLNTISNDPLNSHMTVASMNTYLCRYILYLLHEFSHKRRFNKLAHISH